MSVKLPYRIFIDIEIH